MQTYSITQRKRNILIGGLILLAAIVLVAGFVLALNFKPDIMDPNQIAGAPENLPAGTGYTSYSAAGVATVSLCCAPSYDGRIADVYLTNPADSKVLIKAEFYTVKESRNETTGEITYLPDGQIGETGYIRPGAYVRQVRLKHFPAGQNGRLMIKISTMIESTRESNGFFYIRTTVS